MTTRPRLLTSVPYWLLVVGSLVAVGVGAWQLVSKLAVMTTTLTDGTATGIEVYVGQSAAIAGAILAAAGLVGLALALSLAVARSFVAAPTVTIFDEAWEDEGDDLPSEQPQADDLRSAAPLS